MQNATAATVKAPAPVAATGPKVIARKGWRGLGNVPQFILEDMTRDSATGNTRPARFGYRIFRAGKPEPDATVIDLSCCHPPLLFDEVGYLLSELQHAERVEVYFVNPKPVVGPNTGERPQPEEWDGPTTAAVLSKFANAIADSLHAVGSFSSCEWAYLEVVK